MHTRTMKDKESMQINDAWGSALDPLIRLAEKAVLHSVPIDETEMRAVVANISDCLRWTTDNRNAGVFLQCRINDTVVGMILVKNFWNLSCLFVDPTFHGQGIGRALVAETVRRCIEHAKDTRLKVNSSPNAIGFYHAMGFVQDENRTPKGSSVPMILDLARFSFHHIEREN